MLQISEDEQGFADEDATEYAEYNYTPYGCFKEHHYRLYSNPLKLKNSGKMIEQEQYINKELQKYLLSRFTSQHKGKIVEPSSGFEGISSNFIFDSNFESGNLQYVIHNNNQYELYIKPDCNTMAHFQWFYFKVRNRTPATLKLTIKNFLKPKMSYREGLKPFLKSVAKNQKYYEQLSGNVTFKQSSQDSQPNYYQLSFQYNFQHCNDEVQFCSQPPYTYNRYCKIYKSLTFLRMQISRTILGNKIEAFIVNQNANSQAVVVVMARQHPGESVGSWMMEGFVNKLIENPNQICWILLPMVNIDGVILGNNRTGVQGYDFNRHWYTDEDTQRYHLFPELKGIISYFRRKKKQHAKKIKMFIDFHGHSSQQNVFAYGPPHHKSSQSYDLSKLFPYLISKQNSDFNLQQCSYSIQPQKKNCSRYVFLHKFGFSYSYTIESSFGLYRGRRVNERDMLKMGEDVFLSARDFVELMAEQKSRQAQLKEVLNKMKEQLSEVQENGGQNDSDSDNQDENASIRLQFEKKLAVILSTRQNYSEEESVFDSLTKKRNNNFSLEGEKKSGRQLKSKITAALDRIQLQRDRLKTEQAKETLKPSVRREKSIILPKIKWQDRKSYSSKKGEDPLNLDRLTLQEMKERLIKMKHSELGRRILIINRYQNS